MASAEQLLTCKVCLNRFKEPKTLPCQHTFCLRPCLQNIVEHNSIRCPECHARHRLPCNGVRGLKTNTTIVGFLNLPNQQRPHRRCQECEIGDGDVDKCNHCDEFLCRSCIASHTRGLQQDLRQYLNQVKRLGSKLAESDSDLRERAKKLEGNGRKLKREIAQSMERIISDLQSRKKCLFEEVDTLVATEIGSLQRERNEHKVKTAALKTHCQVASEICELPLTLSNPEIQKLQSEILRLAQRSREHLQSNGILSDGVRQIIKFTNRNENVVLSAISYFGIVSAHAQLAFAADLNPDDGARFCRTPDRPRRQRDAQPSGEDENSCVNEVLQRYRNRGQVKKYFGMEGNDLGQMNSPSGISSTASDHIIVADSCNDRIQIFDVNGVVKRVIGGKGTSEGQFDGVADVCVTSRGRIVASDSFNHRIQIFDERGRFVRTFGSEGSGDGQLKYPCGVETDVRGQIYVCDQHNHRVQVFSGNGQFIRKFRFNSPQYLSVTSNGTVVVGGNHTVQAFDGYGRHLFPLGIEGTNVSPFNQPHGIATDQQGNIIVGDSWNNCIQVFTSNGSFVTWFGSSGSEPGQMRMLEGVCILSDGGIVVTDSGNNRIQIF